MTIEYKVESVSDCLEEIKPLIEKHHEEATLYKEHIELNPDYDSYIKLEETGSICVITVREDTVLIGYTIFIIAPHLHYKDHLFAQNDIVYIDKEYRECGVGLEMFRFAESVLKDRGVSVIKISTRVTNPFDKLCQGLNYDYTDRDYTKFIGDTTDG